MVGREPKREMAGRVLDEYSAETFERAERGAVYHHRRLLSVVFGGIFQLETLRQIVIYLNGPKLPATADGVFHHKIEFGTVEGCFAVSNLGIEAFLFAGFFDGGFALFPDLVGADILLRVFRVAQTDLCLEILEPEDLEHCLNNIHHAQELILHLVGTTKNVGIVLRERTHTRKAVKLAAFLISINGSELCNAQGQIFVRPGLPGKHLAVVRTVHRFEHILLIFFRSADRLE